MSRFTFSIALVCILAGLSPSLRAEEDLFYALCPKSLNNPFWDDVAKGMKAAAEELGVRAEFVAPIEADATQQVQKIEALLEKKVDGIAISPNVPDSIIGVVAKARANGIPVICFDADSPESERLCYVGTFNEQAGFEGGRLMKKLLPGGGKILVVSGGAGALNHNERIAGFKRGIEGGKIETDAIKYCNDDMNRATQLIESYVAANPDVEGIFCTASWAICAANVRRDLNLDLVIVGFDTVEEELQLIKDSYIDGVVGQRPEKMGYESVMALHRLHQAGEKMEEIADDIDTGTLVVTRENVVGFAKEKGYELK
jgi:ribose transport system substrate-binding protein